MDSVQSVMPLCHYYNIPRLDDPTPKIGLIIEHKIHVMFRKTILLQEFDSP